MPNHTSMALTTTLAQLAAQCNARGWMLATAESCTGGMIASACTDLAGSSGWFDRAFITYSNAAKTEMLGVPAALIAAHGAVSEAVVRAMAQGAVQRSQAHLSIAVSGIAGPSGGSADKPVGTVWLAWCLDGVLYSQQRHFDGDRHAVRQQTTCWGLQHALELLQTSSPHPADVGSVPPPPPAPGHRP